MYKNVYIPYRPVNYGISLYRIRMHLKKAFASRSINSVYPSHAVMLSGKIKNAILVLNLSNHVDAYRQNVLSHAINRLYYGVTEGLIKNPPRGFRIIVPSKYVAEE